MALSQYPAFVPGTLTFFQQTTAPTGWTKQTTNDNYTLRIVSGSGSTTINNSVNFSTAMADVTFTGTASSSGSTSADDADLPAHTHTATVITYGGAFNRGMSPTNGPLGGGFASSVVAVPDAFGSSSAGGAHNHSITGSAVPVTGGPGKFAVNYIDFILASKNT
jgi:hypothetical protein